MIKVQLRLTPEAEHQLREKFPQINLPVGHTFETLSPEVPAFDPATGQWTIKIALDADAQCDGLRDLRRIVDAVDVQSITWEETHELLI